MLRAGNAAIAVNAVEPPFDRAVRMIGPIEYRCRQRTRLAERISEQHAGARQLVTRHQALISTSVSPGSGQRKIGNPT